MYNIIVISFTHTHAHTHKRHMCVGITSTFSATFMKKPPSRQLYLVEGPNLKY